MFDRKKQLRWSSVKVGVVVTVTLLIIFFVIVFSGRIEPLFKEKSLLNIYISDVKGLSKGNPVRVSGVEIGSVKDIKLSKEYGTVVKVSIDENVLSYLRSDSKATVQTIGLLGDKYIEIFPGQSQQPLDISKGIYGYPETEAREIIEIASSTINRVEGLVSRIDFLITKVEKGEGTISKLINDPSLYNNLNLSISELKKTVTEINQGSIGMLARDKELYQKISIILKNLEDTSNKIAFSEGTLGKMISDPAVYESLLKSSERLDSLLQEIESSEGTLKMLIRDKTVAEDLKQSIKELKGLIEEIKKDPKKFFKFSVF